jgi:hypothetical protein
MTDDSLERKTLDWLNSQGYPLEFATAAAFQAAGFLITQSAYYVDPTEDTAREIDLIAMSYEGDFDRLIGFRFDVTIECKSSTSKPWVLFTADGTANDRGEVSRGRIANAAGEAWLELVLHGEGPLDTGLLQFDRTVGFGLVKASLTKDRGPDRGYEALHSSVNAAAWLVREVAARTPADWKQRFTEIHVVMPLVVVNDPLFACALGADGKLHLQQIDIADVLWRHPSSGYPLTPVRVVAESRLVTHAKELMDQSEQAFDTLPDLAMLREITQNVARERLSRSTLRVRSGGSDQVS